MLCPNCNAPISENAKFCTTCGAPVPVAEPAPVVVPAPVEPTVIPAPAEPVAPVYAAPPCCEAEFTEKDLPEQYRPLRAWAYFGLTLLYSIPIVGFIFLIIFSFNSGNINRRNFTRSYWCALLIVVILLAIFVIVGGGLTTLLRSSNF